jgi:pilus assembly protein CpaF
MITLEVHQTGQAPRTYRFNNANMTIGFTSQATLPLEPFAVSAPSVEVVSEAGGAVQAKPHDSTPAAHFKVNDEPCLTPRPLLNGDRLSVNGYAITILGLPGSAAKAPAAAPPPAKAASPAPGAGAKPPKTAPAKQGASYLYLFFAPVQDYLMDDDVSEVMINGPHQIYIEKKGKVTPTPASFANEQALQAAVMNVARSMGRYFDKDNPRLDARLPDGSRVHAVMPPLSRLGTMVAIRKFRREKLTLQQLIDFGSITKEGAALLDTIVKSGRNIIVSGATSSGKTSVLNVLSALIPATERILVLEDASELQLQQTHVAYFETRKPDEHGKGEVTIRDLLHSVLRLRPDRIVVGEIRGGEALDLLQAMNTGHDGSMSTIHANSARDSLSRLETCTLLSGIEIPLSAIREQVASAVHVVVQTARLKDGSRKITSITKVLGLENGEYKLEDLYRHEPATSPG